MAKTFRPAPLPQPTAAPSGPIADKRGLPEGAARMSRMWLDAKGLPQHSRDPVPVDADDRRTAHRQARCPYSEAGNGDGRKRCTYQEWLLPSVERFCPSHGKALVAPKDGSRLGTVVADAARLHGRSALPWLLPPVGLLADAMFAATDVGAVDALLAAPALAGVGYLLSRRILTGHAVKARRIERGQKTGRRVRDIRRRARLHGVAMAEAGLWAAALAGTDLTSWSGWLVAAAGMGRWALASKPWWDACDVRRSRGVVKVDAAAVRDLPAVAAPNPIQLRAVATWAALIGCLGGPLAGTELTEFKRLPACEVGASSRTLLPNWRAKVIPTVAGSVNMREQRPNLLGRIAAAYGCTYADVSFAADESDLGVGWLRVQPDNPLAEVRMWQGPAAANDWRYGRSRIGRFEDGTPIDYVWWTKTGAAHDLLSGCSGSGKSETVAQLLLNSLHSGGLVLDWVGDPQGGQSYGHLKDEVDWFARNKSEIKLMLLAAVKEMLRRNDELSASNVKTWRASRAMPLLVITLDEVQAILDDNDILALVEMLVGQGRKCGIKMRLITQIPAAYALGGSTYIKEQLKSGQSLIFRAMTDQAGRDATDGDCPINPTMLPTVWGRHTCAAGETTAGLLFVQGLAGRDVYGRADWTGDDMLRWLVDADGQRTATPGAFVPEAQEVSGVLWGDRVERARRALAAGRSDADLLPGGKAVELIAAASVSTPAPPSAPQAAASGAPTRSREVVLAAARECADDRGLVVRSDLVKAVRGRMADGTRDDALTDLVAAGDLRRIRNGLYEVPAAARVPAGR